jgi:cytoskeletal protein RodZ
MLNLALSRKSAGLSLEQIADGTKISLRFLRAIEEEEFEKLPGGIFSTSYLRQYAMAIGYDEAELLAHYRHKTSPPAAAGKGPAREQGNRSLLDRWLGAAPASLER